MLEPLFSLLQIISGAPVVDQRTLAARAGVSVGKVNALLRQAEQEGYLLAGREGKKSRLTLTPKGRQLLEDTLIDRSGVKLSFPPAGGADTAVILAGGRRSEFDIPVCLQPIGEEEGVTIIDRMLRVLSVCGVSRYIIIAGWQADALRAHFAGRGDLEIVYNERYKWNGTMSGLALAEEALGRFNPASFLVLKSDLVFEQRGGPGPSGDRRPLRGPPHLPQRQPGRGTGRAGRAGGHLPLLQRRPADQPGAGGDDRHRQDFDGRFPDDDALLLPQLKPADRL